MALHEKDAGIIIELVGPFPQLIRVTGPQSIMIRS